MNWSLRYAPHVGYAPADRLLFRAHAGHDRAAHVLFAARKGFAGVLYPWAVDSPPEERAAIAAVLRQTGLECSCVVATPLATLVEALWVTDTPEAQSRLLDLVGRALVVSKQLGSTQLAVLLRGDGHTSEPVQRRLAADRLRRVGDLAAAAGVTLGIEPMISLPGMLLGTFAEGVELVRTVNHPAVKLIFDTGHVTAMGEPLTATYIAAYDDICRLQLADMPGRIEPGSGEIDFVPLLAHAIRRGYSGLVDLEHDWAAPGEDAERRGIEQLAAIDAAARNF